MTNSRPEPSNNQNNFVVDTGRTACFGRLFKASTAAVQGQAVAWDGTNAWYTTASNSSLEFGILQNTISTTDSDYASTKNVNIRFPIESSTEWLAQTNATPTTANIGVRYDLTNGGLLVDLGNSTYKQVEITGIVNAAQNIVRVKLYTGTN